LYFFIYSLLHNSMIELNRGWRSISADISRWNSTRFHDSATFHVSVNDTHNQITSPCLDTHSNVHMVLMVVVVRFDVLGVPQAASKPTF
jgi:hypothetical protein